MILNWRFVLLGSLLLTSSFAHALAASNKELEARADKTDARIAALEERANQSLVQLQQQIDSAKEQLRVLRASSSATCTPISMAGCFTSRMRPESPRVAHRQHRPAEISSPQTRRPYTAKPSPR
jgi:hypothetical protein